MLEVVDELERNGHNLQHFSRELARYFRNLLVARISGADTRLVAASAAERQKLAQIASQFSEEDLSRYLQLSLDLFRDLQFSLQPRFHLEIGLVRLVQAGRLLPIEEALAQVSGAAGTARDRDPRPAPKAAPPAPPPPRTGPSPFDLDRAKKTAAAPAGDPRERLHSYLHEKGLTHLADAVENARIAISGADLNVVAPKSYALYFNDRAMADAAREVFGRPLRVKFAADDAGEPAAPLTPAAGKSEDEVTARALANPEVQRFREVFGGEVRKVRNLKE
jgi:DNA polymerase-3 subunit gamma/tau